MIAIDRDAAFRMDEDRAHRTQRDIRTRAQVGPVAGGEARAIAADNDDVEGLVGAHGLICAARWPAVVPAMRPNTEPAISPVPPG